MTVTQAGVDFRSLTPLECISLADRERIHTETLRWFLSRNSPLEAGGATRLLTHLLQRSAPIEVIDATTEQHYIDLVVSVRAEHSPSYIILENKLKSSESPEQTERYSRAANKIGHVEARLFLTLVGEPARSSEEWKAVSYKTLHEALSDEISKYPPRRNVEFLTDYVDLLSRLVGAVDRVILEPEPYAAIVFGRTERLLADAHLAFREYMDRCRLRMILQRAWMIQLGNEIESRGSRRWRAWFTGENRGEAHLTFHLEPLTANGRHYDLGVQLQYGSIKVFSSPAGYHKGVTAEQREDVASILRHVQKTMGERGNHTQPRDRGFSSFKPSKLVVPARFEFDEWANVILELLHKLADVHASLIDRELEGSARGIEPEPRTGY